MAGFLFTLLAVLLAGVGARDQALISGIVARQGRRPGVLVTAIPVCIATAVLAAWAAAVVAPMLAERARLVMAALALGFAAGEALLVRPGRAPQEPTRSLFALAIVLLAHQVSDAARFLVFGIALGSAAIVPAGAAGAIAGSIVLAAAWAAPDAFNHARVRLARRIVGGCFLVIALVVFARVFA